MKKVSHGNVLIPAEGVALAANLSVPENPRGLVIFSHGSGSSRHSPRNRFVAQKLNEGGMATLLADLLTAREDMVYQTRFDIELLTQRLAAITEWAFRQPGFKNLPVGYFGASTGAASALQAAALLKDKIRAVVSRGGRPDLAKAALPLVKAPTLLIVGSLDKPVIELNEEAYDELKCHKKMEMLEGATHLFEEPGKLEEVARLAAEWFGRYLVPTVEQVPSGP